MVDMDADKFPKLEYFFINPKGHRMEKHIKNQFPEFYKFLNDNYPSELSFLEKLYWYYYDIKEIPKCIECGKNVRFCNFDRGYFQYCSQKCSNNSKLRMGKTNNTIKEKYGVDNISKLDSIKKKKSETLKEHYGVEHWLQCSEAHKRIKESLKEQYGCEYASQVPEIKKKIRQTNIERYGGCGMESKELAERTKRTLINRYGVDNAYKKEDIIEKRKQSSIKKFGTENPFDSDIFKEWLKQYNLDNYGVEYPLQSDKMKEKIQRILLEKYGVDNASQIEGSRDKFIQTMFEKYGGCGMGSDVLKEKIIQTNIGKYGVCSYSKTPQFKQMLNDKYVEIREKSNITKKKNNSFHTSKIEQDFKKWLDDNHINYDYQHHDSKYPFDCDFYFPDKDLYLEIQGSWLHGHHPFDSNNKTDIDTLNKWKNKNTRYYNNAIDVWINRDPLKRQWAKEHNLNWHEIFTIKLDDLISWYNSVN